MRLGSILIRIFYKTIQSIWRSSSSHGEFSTCQLSRAWHCGSVGLSPSAPVRLIMFHGMELSTMDSAEPFFPSTGKIVMKNCRRTALLSPSLRWKSFRFKLDDAVLFRIFNYPSMRATSSPSRPIAGCAKQGTSSFRATLAEKAVRSMGAT